MANVKRMSDDELRKAYDDRSTRADGVEMYSDEINHRELMAALKRTIESLEAVNYNIGQLHKTVRMREEG